MEAVKSNLKFRLETGRKIRVMDPTMQDSLVGFIAYNPALGIFEFDPIDGGYIFNIEDLTAIRDCMSKLDVDRPWLT